MQNRKQVNGVLWRINRMPWRKGKLLIILFLLLAALSFLLLRLVIFTFGKLLTKAYGLIREKIVLKHFGRIISPPKTEKPG